MIWIHISLQLCSCRTCPHGTTPDRLQCQALSNLIICHLTLLLNHNCKISPHCAIGVATTYTHYLCWIDASTFWPYNHGMASQSSDRNSQEQTSLITTANEVAERQFFQSCMSVCLFRRVSMQGPTPYPNHSLLGHVQFNLVQLEPLNTGTLPDQNMFIFVNYVLRISVSKWAVAFLFSFPNSQW